MAHIVPRACRDCRRNVGLDRGAVPDACGRRQSCSQQQDDPEGTKSGSGPTVPDALHTVGFWGLCWVYLFTGVASYTIILQTPVFLVSLGHDIEFAALVQGANGLLAPIGMIVISQLVPRFGQTRIILLSYCSSILGVASLLQYANSHNLLWLGIFVLLTASLWVAAPRRLPPSRPRFSKDHPLAVFTV